MRTQDEALKSIVVLGSSHSRALDTALPNGSKRSVCVVSFRSNARLMWIVAWRRPVALNLDANDLECVHAAMQKLQGSESHQPFRA